MFLGSEAGRKGGNEGKDLGASLTAAAHTHPGLSFAVKGPGATGEITVVCIVSNSAYPY